MAGPAIRYSTSEEIKAFMKADPNTYDGSDGELTRQTDAEYVITGRVYFSFFGKGCTIEDDSYKYSRKFTSGSGKVTNVLLEHDNKVIITDGFALFLNDFNADLENF